ncbi:hypothetical protein FIBSPDRAFT_370112 [Athelia psychrophila]|uniref:Uncharacterized protein n=1 Tax=Athelia psychrophila TaxID=1759441 RepID=A0A167VHI2_9AGAM|nr:hypothetical protein FIBSPDRAFT_370112 [Fibularhizoctonia sp. CBS 109695]
MPFSSTLRLSIRAKLAAATNTILRLFIAALSCILSLSGHWGRDGTWMALGGTGTVSLARAFTGMGTLILARADTYWHGCTGVSMDTGVWNTLMQSDMGAGARAWVYQALERAWSKVQMGSGHGSTAYYERECGKYACTMHFSGIYSGTTYIFCTHCRLLLMVIIYLIFRSEARVSASVFLISVVLARWSCAEDPRAPLSVLPSNFGFCASLF